MPQTRSARLFLIPTLMSARIPQTAHPAPSHYCLYKKIKHLPNKARYMAKCKFTKMGPSDFRVGKSYALAYHSAVNEVEMKWKSQA
jgi:hypothetical protein